MTAAAALRSFFFRMVRPGVLLLPALAFSATADDAAQLSASFARDTLAIEAASGTCYRFDVWLAETPAQQRRGLMFVRELPRFAGMLFLYQEDAVHSMWMKNTYIPLDILFIRADGVVANVAGDTEPLSLRSIPSTEPVRYVLELNAGTAAALGIEPGSRVYLP